MVGLCLQITQVCVWKNEYATESHKSWGFQNSKIKLKKNKLRQTVLFFLLLGIIKNRVDSNSDSNPIEWFG